ncbi:DUF4864 domain-containing protein [Roseobacter litoralis]|uniref:DUF4864 domain-containing protein n=1 Tax=Roseobacter litoralis (strain ATCC 49566 / DSM 6996 / JCM 21268 / NBRC 15278 / OCh 149) TaxID=391595 RepID=F7ZAC8_ROSLO|nr:DUF4864 domain-containing protein [Roseobacter litoralis]AEI95475.1 hypothetical protein RLO149_c035360 [Roseobacter litoralis Och 149]
MRAIVLGVVFSVLAAFGAVASPKDMRDVIDNQLSAFQQDDFAQAMEYASPGLQRYFATPENFRRMVTQGYPMVWRPDTVEYLENRTEDGIHWQRVRIKDMEGKVHILDYRMLETENGWRINGVQILDAADFIT